MVTKRDETPDAQFYMSKLLLGAGLHQGVEEVKRTFLAAALFAACMICAPIFTEAIAAPVQIEYLTPDMTALPAAPADTFVAATPVRFCAVTRRSSTETIADSKSAATITSDRYHIRC